MASLGSLPTLFSRRENEALDAAQWFHDRIRLSPLYAACPHAASRSWAQQWVTYGKSGAIHGTLSVFVFLRPLLKQPALRLVHQSAFGEGGPCLL